ncbi:MAG: tetratricopeptide repeat protein [Chloroflexi bacterium]|nr:tetratricopeptide repeat protein [Chloroflexota bacterium]
MNRRRRRPNYFWIALLCLLVLAGAWVDRFIVPNQPQYGVPSPTPTRSPEAFITEAQEYFNQGKLLPAIASYKQAIASNPTDSTIYVALAQVQVFAGQYTDAQKSAENAILLNKNSSMAYAVLGWAMGFQGNYLEAENNIKKALTLDDRNALAHAYYAEILVGYSEVSTAPPGIIDKAIEESRVARDLAPDKLETYRVRGIILEKVGAYQDAIVQYNQAIAINGNIADLHLSLGINYRALQFYEQAITEFITANSLNPDDPLPDLYLSRVYATNGDYVPAMQYAETAVSNAPTDTRLRGNLGVMYYRNGYWEKSAKELGYVVNGGFAEDGKPLNAVNLVPEDVRLAEYYYTYGLTLSRLNKCGEALDIVRMINELIPTNGFAMEAATAIIDRCQKNLEQTPIPPFPTAPEPALTPTVTPTPKP